MSDPTPRCVLVIAGRDPKLARAILAAYRAGIPAMCLECDRVLEWESGVELTHAVSAAIRHARGCANQGRRRARAAKQRAADHAPGAQG